MMRIRTFTHGLHPTRLRSPAFALLALLAGAACDDRDPLATSAPSDPPAVAATADTVTTADALTPAFASVSYSGIPFGPFGLWNSYTTVAWGPSPFTTSQSYVSAGGIVTLINSARLKKQRLVLAMTGGPSTNYTTNGKFDMAKWKNRMNTFKTTTIRNAVAAGVADGTIVGNSIIDEPETPRWGGVMTKPLLDQMAGYVKASFPTLPVGVNHGATGYYLWRTTERYRVVDYVMSSYVWWITKGNVTAWRDALLARARLDGVRVGFGLNVLDGGIKKIPPSFGAASCPIPQTGGVGTYAGAGGQNCRMTAAQVRDWGRALGVAGCALLIWKYEGTFMSKSANLQAFRDVAYTLASKPRPSCRRS